MSDPRAQLQTRLAYAFRNPTLLETALTHPSYLPEHPEAESNQRLEFLGDSVLQLILTEALFGAFPDEREGVLTKRRALLANGLFLARLARDTGIDQALRLSASEETSGGRTRPVALGDAFEAVIGALYLDSDYATTRRVVLDLYGSLPERLAHVEEVGNPKGRLQELVQPRHGNNAIRYDVVRATGEDHAREFEVAVYVLDERLGTGRGSSKKVAEEGAAREAVSAWLARQAEAGS